MAKEKNDPLTDSTKNGLDEMFNYQANFIELTRQLDIAKSKYVELEETVKDCIFRNPQNIWRLKPEVAQFVLTLTEQKSQLDKTDNKDNDN